MTEGIYDIIIRLEDLTARTEEHEPTREQSRVVHAIGVERRDESAWAAMVKESSTKVCWILSIFTEYLL